MACYTEQDVTIKRQIKTDKAYMQIQLFYSYSAFS